MSQNILHKIIDARKILILDHSFWGSLALRLTLKEDKSCKTGWTDGVTLGYNPFWIETLSNKGTVAWCAHEVCHPMCQHHTRRGGRNHKLWQIAADYVVNSILVKAGFELPGKPLHDPRFDGMSTDEVYSTIEKEMEEKSKEKRKNKSKDKGGKGEGEKSEGENKKDEEDDSPDDSTDPSSESTDDDSNDKDTENDGDSGSDGNSNEENQEDNSDDLDKDNPDEDDLDENDSDEDDSDKPDPDPGNCGEVRDYPGKDNSPSPSDLKEQEQEWKIATVQAATQAKKCGSMPAGLDAEIQNIVESKVDPRDLLQNFVAQSAKNDFAWVPPNRKYIHQGLYLPSMKSEELGTVILVLDTSISIGQKELDNFSAIVSAILETYIIDAIVLYCDTEVYEPEYFKREDLPLKLKMKGRGGTSFKKPFEWVREHDIDPVCLIYLTDLECDDYPDFEPDYPVVWISTTLENNVYWGKPPFGEIIYIDLEEK